MVRQTHVFRLITVRYRQSDEKKKYKRSANRDGQMFFRPVVGDDPSPMYDGLRTNLPYVSRCTEQH